jgi:hypothetical protein
VLFVEVAPPLGNNLRRPLLRLVGLCFGSSEGLGGYYLARSRVSFEASDLVGEDFCPSLGLFEIGIDDAFFGEALGRYAYHYFGDSGWWFTCNCLGGFFPLSVASSSIDLGMPTMLTATPMFLGDGMASGHLLWLGRSTVLCHVIFGMLLIVPMKIFEVSLSGRVLASSSNLGVHLLLVWGLLVEGLLHSSATKTTRTLGDPCMDKNVNFLFFQWCFCKSCHVNLDLYM